MRFNPFIAFVKTHRYLLQGRLHFPRERVGQPLTMPDGETATVFREVRVDPRPGQPVPPGATFHVRFHLAGMSPGLNKVFSLLPIPFFVGLPGFRSKRWALDPVTGDFHGLYTWDSVAHAERYAHSFAIKFMTRRSVPGSVAYEIIPEKAEENGR